MKNEKRNRGGNSAIICGISAKTIAYRFKILPKSLEGIPLPLCGIGMTGRVGKNTKPFLRILQVGGLCIVQEPDSLDTPRLRRGTREPDGALALPMIKTSGHCRNNS